MIIKDTCIFNCVFEFTLFIFFFQFAFFLNFFFLMYGEAGTPPSSSPLHPAPASTVFTRMLFFMWFSALMRTTVHCRGNIHRIDNVLPLNTGRRHFPLCWLSSQAPRWGTWSIPGERLSPAFNTPENNSSPSSGLESAARASWGHSWACLWVWF